MCTHVYATKKSTHLRIHKHAHTRTHTRRLTAEEKSPLTKHALWVRELVRDWEWVKQRYRAAVWECNVVCMGAHSLNPHSLSVSAHSLTLTHTTSIAHSLPFQLRSHGTLLYVHPTYIPEIDPRQLAGMCICIFVELYVVYACVALTLHKLTCTHSRRCTRSARSHTHTHTHTHTDGERHAHTHIGRGSYTAHSRLLFNSESCRNVLWHCWYLWSICVWAKFRFRGSFCDSFAYAYLYLSMCASVWVFVYT